MYSYVLQSMPFGVVKLHWLAAPTMAVDEYWTKPLIENIRYCLAPWWGPVLLNSDSEACIREEIDEELENYRLQLLPPDCLGEATRALPDIESGAFRVATDSYPRFNVKNAYEELGVIGYIEHRFGAWAAEWITSDLEKLGKDLDYVDNWRACAVGDPESEKYYLEAQENGCCGSTDKVVHVGFKKFKIGLNYGH